MDSIHQARLAQSVEHQTLNRRVVGSSPTLDKKFFILYFVASDALLAGRLAPCKWNQAWRPSELYMCIEREKVDFKSREVNCLKECALALSSWIAEQEDRGSIPGLATWIFRDWLSPASKTRYGWKIAKSTLILKTTNQPTNQTPASISTSAT